MSYLPGAMRVRFLAGVCLPLLACGPAPPGDERTSSGAREEKRTFDEESRLAYGVVAPPVDEGEMSRAREELSRLFPGKGPLAARYATFQKQFLVPKEKLDSLLARALEECRRRTLEHLDLPAGENVRVERVSGAPWPSFARYRGDFGTVVQLNGDFPLSVSDIVEVAGHEGYPGHHVLNVLRERSLGRERAIVPPAGREAFFHEGLASYGLELAFPGDERLRFERDVLFPLAGLDPSQAELHFRVARELRRLAPLRVEAARAYLERKRDRVQSVIWLENEALVPAPWAFLGFVDRYRTYVVSYTLGPELVRHRIESRGSDP
ncbi:MAG TPA: hypothetical protein VIE88_08485, partial [Vicinamibacteria bacterium]